MDPRRVDRDDRGDLLEHRFEESAGREERGGWARHHEAAPLGEVADQPGAVAIHEHVLVASGTVQDDDQRRRRAGVPHRRGDVEPHRHPARPERDRPPAIADDRGVRPPPRLDRGEFLVDLRCEGVGIDDQRGGGAPLAGEERHPAAQKIEIAKLGQAPRVDRVEALAKRRHAGRGRGLDEVDHREFDRVAHRHLCEQAPASGAERRRIEIERQRLSGAQPCAAGLAGGPAKHRRDRRIGNLPVTAPGPRARQRRRDHAKRRQPAERRDRRLDRPATLEKAQEVVALRALEPPQIRLEFRDLTDRRAESPGEEEHRQPVEAAIGVAPLRLARRHPRHLRLETQVGTAEIGAIRRHRRDRLRRGGRLGERRGVRRTKPEHRRDREAGEMRHGEGLLDGFRIQVDAAIGEALPKRASLTRGPGSSARAPQAPAAARRRGRRSALDSRGQAPRPRREASQRAPPTGGG